MDYYWSSIKESEKIVLKRITQDAKGSKTISYWRIRRTQDTLVYNLFNENKKLVAQTKELITMNGAFFLENKWKLDDKWITDKIISDTAFLSKKSTFGSSFIISYKQNNIPINGDVKALNTLSMLSSKEVHKIDGVVIPSMLQDLKMNKCVKWEVSHSSYFLANQIDKDGFHEEFFQVNYCLKGRGVVFAKRTYPNNTEKNVTIITELIPLSEF